MLQYLVVILDDLSVAYCHASNPLKERNLIPVDTLKRAILFGMKENLMIQFVYPDYDLPEEYNAIIESIDHIKIGWDVAVYNDVPETVEEENVVLRITIEDFLERQESIAALLSQVNRLNICLTNIDSFKDEQIDEYARALSTLNASLLNQYLAGKQPQLNIITDRLQLTKMHNCGAGDSNITIAPNGKFYLCPAFNYDEQTGVNNRLNHHIHSSDWSVGNLESGLSIPNQQLLKIDHAPLCRVCDAYHCNRCIWLNQKLTWDNNTPSHQQCVIAHLERNASRNLQNQLIAKGCSFGEVIKEINYLDPFDVRDQK